MRIFLAGIIQGAKNDGGIHAQDYRSDIKKAVAAVIPVADFVDPHAENPHRLNWDRGSQRDMFFRYVEEAARCDLMIAWLPEPSMGTAVEMYEAYRAGVPVVAVTPMENVWAVFALATYRLPDLDALTAFLAGEDFARMTAASTRSTGLRGA